MICYSITSYRKLECPLSIGDQGGRKRQCCTPNLSGCYGYSGIGCGCNGSKVARISWTYFACYSVGIESANDVIKDLEQALAMV